MINPYKTRVIANIRINQTGQEYECVICDDLDAVQNVFEIIGDIAQKCMELEREAGIEPFNPNDESIAWMECGPDEPDWGPSDEAECSLEDAQDDDTGSTVTVRLERRPHDCTSDGPRCTPVRRHLLN